MSEAVSAAAGGDQGAFRMCHAYAARYAHRAATAARNRWTYDDGLGRSARAGLTVAGRHLLRRTLTAMGERGRALTLDGLHDAKRVVSVAVLATALVLARLLVTGNPFRLVWSEDGLFWARTHQAFGEWQPLAGYLNAVPSALVTVSRLLPMSAYPVWAVVASCAIVGALTAFVNVCARRIVGDGAALLAAAAMPLVPALRVDTLGSLANLQWFLAPACFWALIRPWSGRLGRVAVAVALSTGLSCAVAVVLIPVGLIRRAWWATAALCVGEGAQVLVVVTGPPSALRERRWPDGALAGVLWLAGGRTPENR
jgi:hypothetical protein